tara:strand:+ start:1087 stop:1299 length:213 start_codon:yes stop_codon:yes gene_type:complete
LENGIWERITLNTGNMNWRDFISKANNFLTNNKPRLKSNTRQSGYEPHASSSFLNWLEGDWVPGTYSANP